MLLTDARHSHYFGAVTLRELAACNTLAIEQLQHKKRLLAAKAVVLSRVQLAFASLRPALASSLLKTHHNLTANLLAGCTA